ncbi:MAG TPA: exodeoxyribonuclease V subunit alpha [Pseudoxanthomonas sp.]
MSASVALQALQRKGALRTVDLAFAQLLQRLGATTEVMLAGALAMRAVALGHSGFTLARAGELLEELDASTSLPDLVMWTAALEDSALVASDTQTATPLTFEHGRVSLRRYARYEADLVARLLARTSEGLNVGGASAPTLFQGCSSGLKPLPRPEGSPLGGQEKPLPQELRQLFALKSGSLDLQALATWLALRQRLTLVTGGPGTGKTTTVARMLALLVSTVDENASPRIALAAPTGRAAARLGEAVSASLQRDVDASRLDPALAERIPREAQTLHRLLGWRTGKVGFRHDAGNPLPFDVVVVDEASMIDLPLMAKLVAAVGDQARLVLLGDPDQLPAVEAGNVLGALCDAAGDGVAFPVAQAAAASAALQAEVPVSDSALPLAGHRVHLQRGYRQAGAAHLTELARAIRDGDADSACALLRSGSDGLQWQEGSAAQLEKTLSPFALPDFQAMATAPDPQAALRLSTRTRVLTAMRKGAFGADTWNAWFARRLGGVASPWFHGRLVMITANSYRHGLFNGDTGIAWQEDDGETVVWFESNGEYRPWRTSQLPAHDSAFASTVHKAQGSEFDRIALVLPDNDARVLNRELVYTALTRARHSVLLWSPQAILETAIARRTHRDTGLLARFGVDNANGG